MKSYNKSRIIKSLNIGLLCIVLSSCKKFIDVPVPNSALNGPAVFSSDATATATINGIYERMMDENYIQGNRGLSMLTGLASDEFALYAGFSSVSPPLQSYYSNSLSSQNDADTWRAYYNYLSAVNSILEGVAKSASLSADVRSQLEGEAKFLRAFFYFYLTNLYGDIPLNLTSDWRTNSAAGRTPKAQVFQQIVQDLLDAKNLLSDKYLKGDAKSSYTSGSEERVRPTKWAATALLARAYLYIGDWQNAEVQSDAVIANTDYYQILSELNTVFLKNSKEAVWQLMPVNNIFSTLDASLFIITGSGPSNSRPVYLTTSLLNSFEPNDKRSVKGNWVNSIVASGTTYYFPFKYKVRNLIGQPGPTEYFTLLRLSEQYLIRSEARAHLNNISGSIDDLDKIRSRAGLSLVANTNPNISQSALLEKIIHERQVELFTEMGHRWLDLKRTNVDVVMSVIEPQKAPGSQWQPFKQYWPIFYTDVTLNKNLAQTPGY